MADGVVLVEAVRRCLYCVRGGRERSCFTGSAAVVAAPLVVSLGLRTEVDRPSPMLLPFCVASLGLRVDVDRCKPLAFAVAGLLIFARGGGGRIEVLLATLPFELGGRVELVALRVVGFVGSLLGD